jgi:hypothetical protein
VDREEEARDGAEENRPERAVDHEHQRSRGAREEEHVPEVPPHAASP